MSWIGLSQQIHLLLLEFADRLLGHLLGGKRGAIDKGELCVDRFELGIGLKGDVFACVQIDL